eukprot:81641-Chlamydomonas_euryale.AAC.31
MDRMASATQRHCQGVTGGLCAASHAEAVCLMPFLYVCHKEWKVDVHGMGGPQMGSQQLCCVTNKNSMHSRIGRW